MKSERRRKTLALTMLGVGKGGSWSLPKNESLHRTTGFLNSTIVQESQKVEKPQAFDASKVQTF